MQEQPLADDEFVLSTDEKTSIQARRRRHPTRLPQLGGAMRVEHEYRRDGAWAYLAALGTHGNTQAPAPEMEIGSWMGCGGGTQPCTDGSFYFKRVEQLRDIMVRNGDGDKQIWVLEFGWTSDQINPSYAWFAVSEDQKAENIVRAFQYARQHWAVDRGDDLVDDARSDLEPSPRGTVVGDH